MMLGYDQRLTTQLAAYAERMKHIHQSQPNKIKWCTRGLCIKTPNIKAAKRLCCRSKSCMSIVYNRPMQANLLGRRYSQNC